MSNALEHTPEQIRSLMEKPNNIRNMCVIAHVDHGKSTLTDSLVGAAGILNPSSVGNARITDTRDDEQKRGITIKSTGITMCYTVDEKVVPPNSEGREFLVNLIDSPGHVDFSSEVTAALRVTDGALVVVDCVEGVCVQTETVLRQALAEKIVPVLIVNKVDRIFIELKMNHEDAYKKFRNVIESVNVIISTYNDKSMGDLQVIPEKATVAFGSGYYAWGFSLNTFARYYSEKFGVDKDRMIKKLWGDNYYDMETKKWTTKSTNSSGQLLKRGFCQFILEPIQELTDSILDNDVEKYTKLLNALKIELNYEEKKISNRKDLLKLVMRRWLPFSETLLELIVVQLPSPIAAQRYRVENLYEGPLDDECANGIRNCDPNGPLMIYISKMVPIKGRIYSFGRIFSGTVSAGNKKLRIMGANYVPGSKDDLFIKSAQGVVVMMGRYVVSMENVPCGNTVALIGIDKYLLKAGTISDNENAYIIRSMKFSVSPVVRIAVKPKNAQDLPKLVEGLKLMVKTDQLVQTFVDSTGEHIVAGAGSLHLEICLKDLKEDYCKGIEIIESEPLVSYCETVSETSNQICLSKSANGHNRLYMSAQKLPDKFPEAMEKGEIVINKQDQKALAKDLSERFGFDPTEVKKIWCFGPEGSSTNMLVDVTKSVQYINEIKDSVVTGFNDATRYGVLCDEMMRGVRFNIHDVTLHTDAIHRGGSQIIPATKSCLYASVLTASPRILEPIYLVEITCPESTVGNVYSLVAKKRGNIFEVNVREGTPIQTLKAYLPVNEALDFNEELRSATSGTAFPQLVFDHWEIMDSNPLEPESKSYEIVRNIRKRKGLSDDVPPLERFLDKL